MTDFGTLMIPNPKRQSRARVGWEGFFPYYAGFPEGFVSAILDQLQMPTNSLVADPWNGSGTTTYTSNIRGLPAWGGDINPAMVIIAKARLLPPSEADSLVPLASEICRLATRLKPNIQDDPLLAWFDLSTATGIRKIELSIRRHLIGRLVAEGSENRLQHMSTLAAAFYVTLFTLVRSQLDSLRTSNPTWLRKSLNCGEVLSVSSDFLVTSFKTRIASMASSLRGSRLPTVNAFCPSILQVADTTQSFIKNGTVDLVITSPPYCTRIDYTSATRIELALIEPWLGVASENLSMKMLGSIKVPKTAPTEDESWGEACLGFLRDVRNHQSKASSGYYYKNHADYFDKLSRSLRNLSDAIRPSGAAVLVVQDSFYKNIYNPLPQIVSEMARNVGLKKLRQEDFTAARTLSSVNKKSQRYRVHSSPLESVLCFGKEP